MKTRKVFKGKAKDYCRNAKYYYYYYIFYKNYRYTLNLNGWNYPWNLKVDKNYVVVDNEKILLKF